MRPWIVVVMALALAAGCSSKDKGPTNPGTTPDSTVTTKWDATIGAWRTTVDATSYGAYRGYSFTSRDTVAGSAWDVAFRREVVKLNGGASGPGEFEGAALGAVAFASVSRADSTGAAWEADGVTRQINAWYTYDPVQHQVAMTRNVYSMLDASGRHYVKFRIDAVDGSTGPSDMGTVRLSYFYQGAADDRSLPGPVDTVLVNVGTGTAYLDFSAGGAVQPADPGTSLDWDLAFQAYAISQNSGPSGPGACAAFPAYGELTDPTDIDAFAEQPAGAPLFPDSPGSALTDWYDYNEQTHQLASKNHVYLLRSGSRLYKLQILGYYADRGGNPVSAVYGLVWKEL